MRVAHAVRGLTFATVVTLLLVPVLYTIMIRDLRLIEWNQPLAAVRTTSAA